MYERSLSIQNSAEIIRATPNPEATMIHDMLADILDYPVYADSTHSIRTPLRAALGIAPDADETTTGISFTYASRNRNPLNDKIIAISLDGTQLARQESIGAPRMRDRHEVEKLIDLRRIDLSDRSPVNKSEPAANRLQLEIIQLLSRLDPLSSDVLIQRVKSSGPTLRMFASIRRILN